MAMEWVSATNVRTTYVAAEAYSSSYASVVSYDENGTAYYTDLYGVKDSTKITTVFTMQKE